MRSLKRTMLYTSLVVCVVGAVSLPFVLQNKSMFSTNISETDLYVSDINESSIENLVVETSVSSIDEEVSKSDIFYMMLNSIYNYDTVSGKIVDAEGYIERPITVEFACDLVNGESHENVIVSTAVLNDNLSQSGFTTDEIVESHDIADVETSMDVFCKNGEYKNFDNINNQVLTQNIQIIKKSDVAEIDDENRITEIDGEKCYGYLASPSSILYARICTQPQEMAYGFLEDQSLWEIEGETEYLDRNCYIIEGTTEPDYGAKLNVESFMFLVDSETGMLLKYIGFDSNGELSDYMYAEEISFTYDADEVNSLLAEKQSLNYIEIQ